MLSYEAPRPGVNVLEEILEVLRRSREAEFVEVILGACVQDRGIK